MNIVRFLLIFLVCSVCFKGFSQASIAGTKLEEKQTKSSFLPVNVGSGVNSAYDEINPVISPDGKTLYFIRINHPDNNYGKNDSQDVWYSELQADKTWGPAKHFNNFINNARYNAVLSISNDGKRLLISGVYNGSKRWYKNGLSVVSKFGDEWGIPEKVKIPAYKRFSEGQVSNAFLSYDGQYLLLAITKRYNGKKLDLYVSKYEDGYWSKPKSLGKSINTRKYSEESPFLSNNNEILYFASKRPTGKGSFDLYKSNRMSANWEEWTTPVILSDTINSGGYESYFKCTKRGNYAYFVSTSNSLGGADIFKIKLYEEQPYVVVSGKIRNKKTNELMTSKKEYSITINDMKVDSIKINFDSATYKFKIPYGKNYVAKVLMKNYKSDPDTLKFKDINEYTEVTKDLYVEPIPYVVVRGTFLDRNTGLAIPPAASPKLVVNGAVVDSAKIELSTSSYSVKLPYGKTYSLSLQAFKYNPVIDTLNLESVTEYKEISKPLLGEKEVEKIVTRSIITGKVIDKKTGKPILSSVPFNIVVDSLPNLVPQINAVTSEYTIEVTPGRKYTLGARAEKYYPIFEIVDLTKEKGQIKVIKDLLIAPVVIGQAVRMNNIFFISGKAQLTPASYPELDKLAKFLLENPSLRVEIAGHTDNVGKKDKNLQLSRWRARAVELYIEAKGVPTTQVSFNGYGDTKPVAPNKTPWGKSQNRRVEFIIREIVK
ncbi:MAG: OmpA family protein [Bacteroidota bacterium]|nr:OmpA family protein [Bacteroidota bacterium]